MPNKLDFELSKLALGDINKIWIYTANNWSTTQANKYYKDLFKKINLICINPELGRLIESVKPQHRMLRAKSHLIIYKKVKNKIFIDRILHEKMDVENRLNE